MMKYIKIHTIKAISEITKIIWIVNYLIYEKANR